MKNLLTARIFSFFVIFSMLFSALGMPNIVAQAATTVALDGTPTVYKVGSTSGSGSGSNISFSHTTGTGSDRLLLVGVSYNANTNNSPVSSVTFTYGGGTVLTLSQAIGKKLSWLYRFDYIFYSPTEPPSGTSGTVTVTFGNSVASGIVAGAANFANVDLTTPIGPSNGFETVSAAPSVTVNGLVGDELVFDNLFMGGTTPAATVVGAGQTILTGWNTNQGNSFGGASTKDAGGNTSATMSWTPTGTPAGTFIWIHLAAAINPVCTGDRYTLTLGTDPNGTVTQSPAGTSFCAGRTVTLTPVPNSTYVFNGWGGENGVDMAPAGGGTYTIQMSGNKSVTPIFALAQTPPCPNTANLNPVADTFISGATGAALFNYGGATSIQVDRGSAATTRRYALLKWDVSTIPTNAIVNSASVVLNVTTASATGAFPMYDVTKPWVEGTQNGTADTAGASWTNYNTTGPFPWGTAGASMTATGSIDRDTVNLWSAASGSFTPVGSRTVNLTAGGLTVVRRWLAGGVNNGVIIQDSASGSSVPMAFTSREGSTAPVLSVNYCLPAGGVTHDLTVAVDPPGAGTTTPSVGVHTYAENTIVPVTASAASGYIFDHWSGDCSGSTCSVTMSTDMSVTANFVVAKNLTMAVATNRGGPGGTTTPSVGAHPYAINTTVDHITASTNTGYSFDHWSGACTGTDPTDGGCSVYMDDDKTVTANFTINTYALNLTFGGGGGGSVTSAPSGIDCTSDCSNSFDYNTPVVLTANAATGSRFDGWSGASCSGTGTCSVTMTAIRDVTATFSLIPTYDLTMAVDPLGGGTTDPAVGSHTYNDGTLVSIAATAASGYVFDHWTGDVSNANAASTTVTMSADKSVTAVFTASSFGYIGDAGPSVYADASGTSLVMTVGSAGVAVGNTIIVGVASRGVSGYTTPTIADSKSNTYTSALCSLAYSHGREYLFYAPVTTALVAGDTITFTSSPAVTNRVMVASVFSGLLTSGQLDQTKISTDCSSTASATASNNATSGATADTTQADELVIGLIAAEDSGGTTPVDAGLGTWLNSFMAGATQKSQNTNSYRWRVSMGRYYASATGTFTAAQTYTNNPYWVAGVATFKAVQANHTVIFDANGGTGTMSPESHNVATALTTNTFTRTGYTFSGWNTIDVGGGTAYADGAIYPFDADVTLYAQWTALPNHTVTFDANGGSGTMSDQAANVPTALTLNTFTRAAYTFNGWNTQADGLGTSYADGATYPFSADATLYAQWTAFTNHTVTFDNNGGTGTMSDQVANVPTALTLNTFTRVAYTFNGWNTQTDGLGTSFADGATYPFSADATLYAKWIPICYALTLSHTGSGSDPVAALDHSAGCAAGKYIFGEEIGLSGAVPGTGYQITGWTGTINNSSTAATNTVSMPASDHAAGVNYEDFTPPVLTITGSTADGVDMSGSLSTGYILNTTNNVALSDHLIQFKSTTSANEDLKDTYFGLTLTGSTMSHDALKAYYAARGIPEPYLSYLIGAVDGINPFVYIKGNGTTAVSLVDAAKHDIAHLADVAMAVPDDFHRGTYTVQGQIQDLAGNPATITLKLIVAGTRISAVSNDYDGDGITDPAKFDPSTGIIWWQKSTTGLWDGLWMGGDTFSYYGASDYDGDGKVDPAKFYPGTGVVWWVKSSTGVLSGQWLGPDAFTYISGSDFDGDGQSDPAKFYPGTGTVWWVKSTTGTLDGQWLGPDLFTYVSGSDFDGDGKTDPAKFYPETGVVWWVKSTTGSLDGMWLGPDTFTYVQASDFDGDGKTDPAKFYPDSGNLWWVKSTTGSLDGAWLGPGTFTYVAGSDFNGDGKTDPTKYDASTHTLSWLNVGTGAWTDIDMGEGTYTLANGQ